MMMAALAVLLFSLTACAESADSSNDPDSGCGAPNQSMMEGKRDGGQGGGMSNQDSEPDEELQAILDEVQDKYQLLTFTDPDTGFEMQYELFVPENYADVSRKSKVISCFFCKKNSHLSMEMAADWRP